MTERICNSSENMSDAQKVSKGELS